MPLPPAKLLPMPLGLLLAPMGPVPALVRLPKESLRLWSALSLPTRPVAAPARLSPLALVRQPSPPAKLQAPLRVQSAPMGLLSAPARPAVAPERLALPAPTKLPAPAP